MQNAQKLRWTLAALGIPVTLAAQNGDNATLRRELVIHFNTSMGELMAPSGIVRRLSQRSRRRMTLPENHVVRKRLRVVGGRFAHLPQPAEVRPAP